ncbi:MAG: nickel-dependent hydrogenase large subunit, partial [Candidatus Competibacterales bacterium]|nr:nickel-dependent hydrogenase large subunit [Candidatus Competibacterales bacterium]
MARLVVGPFNRVEGDLEVRLDVADGRVRAAWVNSPLYRGFEQILLGRDPGDALVIAPRVCGICSVAHSAAASLALARAGGAEPPPNGRRTANLILACENLADHFTHFYLFFMPDFARAVYRDRPWHEAVRRRFRATTGSARQDALGARAGLLHIMGIAAGKWPHTLALQPGGTTRALGTSDRVRLLTILGGFRRYLERQLFGDALEQVGVLNSGAALAAWCAARDPGDSDLRLFLEVARDLALERLGGLRLPLMSYGAYPTGEGHHFGAGLYADGAVQPLALDTVTEDLSHTWMNPAGAPRHPAEGVTLPSAAEGEGYTWCKAPRLAGQAVEVGAVARQTVAGQPLIRELVERHGSNVLARVLARLLELARVVPLMEQWVRELDAGPFFAAPEPLPDSAAGVGLTEAARGSLGHWLQLRDGRIHNYQIVAPTTWNFSPR